MNICDKCNHFDRAYPATRYRVQMSVAGSDTPFMIKEIDLCEKCYEQTRNQIDNAVAVFRTRI
jgi:hypothetical protein